VVLASALPAWSDCAGFTCRLHIRPVARWRRRLRGAALRCVAARRRRLLPMAARPPDLPPLRVASSSTVLVAASSSRNGAVAALPYSPAPHRPHPPRQETRAPRSGYNGEPCSRHLLRLHFHASPSEDGRKMGERRENTLKWVALQAIADFPPLLVLSTGRMNSSIFP
jgi:hypothetical protein